MSETDDIIERCLSDEAWRLRNLYMIQPKSGGAPIPFIPKPAQEEFLANVHWRNVILKARQIGFSTLVGILFLDRLLFSRNQRGGIIDKTLPDAQRKLDIIRFAYRTIGLSISEEVHQVIKQMVPPLLESSKTGLRWGNDSEIYVGTTLRGGTLQLLHVSEFGYTAFHQPDKAQQIFSGALEAAQQGLIVFESTHEGGRTGKHYDLIDQATKTPEPQNREEWKLHFFPWWKDEGYRLANSTPKLTEPQQKYFQGLKQAGIELDQEQVAWYVAKQKVLRHEMLNEHPSTPGDVFDAPVEGAIYGPRMADLKAAGRVKEFGHENKYPVFTYWDIGQSDSTAIWAVQLAGRDILWLNWYENEDEPPSHYAEVMREWSNLYPVAGHFLPHDAGNRTALGQSYVEALRICGLKRITVLPRTPDVWRGINELRELFPRCWFHARCAEQRVKDGERLPSGVEHLEQYRKHVVEAGSILRDRPVHDLHSHSADAARTFAEAYALGFVKGHTTMMKPKPALLPYG